LEFATDSGRNDFKQRGRECAEKIAISERIYKTEFREYLDNLIGERQQTSFNLKE
jgi:hypothetical protein